MGYLGHKRESRAIACGWDGAALASNGKGLSGMGPSGTGLSGMGLSGTTGEMSGARLAKLSSCAIKFSLRAPQRALGLQAAPPSLETRRLSART